MAGRRAAGPHGYRRRTAGTWYAANTGHGQGRPVVEHAPGGKRPVTERRGPARQARFQGRRIRRFVPAALRRIPARPEVTPADVQAWPPAACRRPAGAILPGRPAMLAGTSVTACAGRSGSRSQWPRRAAGPHGYRRRMAGTWYAANTGQDRASCRGTCARRQAACHRASRPCQAGQVPGTPNPPMRGRSLGVPRTPGRRPCRRTPRQSRPPLRSSERLPETSVSLPGITLSDKGGQGERAHCRR